MTSTAGTDEHPEVSEISAFTEGILPPERSADLRGHLTHCLLCADVRDSLNEIRSLLGTLPGPPRMPEEVASRIDAALAAEALISATAPDRAPESASPATPPRIPTAGGAHVSRETSLPAGRPAGRAGAATGPGRTSRKSRRRWTVVTAACAVAALGLGGVLAHSLGADDRGTTSVASSTFSGVQLPVKVHQLIAGKAGIASPNTGPQVGENTPFAAKPSPVPKCVLDATGRQGNPLGSSQGTYEGRSSYLVVLPDPADSRRVDAFVVDSSCVTSGSAKGTVLTQQTYSRR